MRGDFCIDIMDDGPGVDPQQAKQLFEPFLLQLPVVPVWAYLLHVNCARLTKHRLILSKTQSRGILESFVK